VRRQRGDAAAGHIAGLQTFVADAYKVIAINSHPFYVIELRQLSFASALSFLFFKISSTARG